MGTSQQIIYFQSEQDKIEFLNEHIGKECWVGTENIHCKLDELPKTEFKNVIRFYDEFYNVSDLLVSKPLTAKQGEIMKKLNERKKRQYAKK